VSAGERAFGSSPQEGVLRSKLVRVNLRLGIIQVKVIVLGSRKPESQMRAAELRLFRQITMAV
jgi:hypothetical protein